MALLEYCAPALLYYKGYTSIPVDTGRKQKKGSAVDGVVDSLMQLLSNCSISSSSMLIAAAAAAEAEASPVQSGPACSRSSTAAPAAAVAAEHMCCLLQRGVDSSSVKACKYISSGCAR